LQMIIVILILSTHMGHASMHPEPKQLLAAAIKSRSWQ